MYQHLVLVWQLQAQIVQKTFSRVFLPPLPVCKGFYFISAALNGISCATSSLCLLSGYSCIAPLPVLAGTIAYGTSVGAKACNSLTDCMDPTAVLTVDTSMDLATKIIILREVLKKSLK
jgi:hypothetical protein